MKRKLSRFPHWEDYDVLQDIDPTKLQLIGAVAAQWNFVEDILNETIHVALMLDNSIASEVSSRINGMDGKTQILHKAVRLKEFFTEQEKKLFKTAIDGVSEHKKYRDDIIHSRIMAPKTETAVGPPKRGGPTYEILVSNEALKAVYDRLACLGYEMIGAWRAFEWTMFQEGDLIADGGYLDPEQLRSSPYFQDAISLVHAHQTRRLSLPPLPKFPDGPPTLRG